MFKKICYTNSNGILFFFPLSKILVDIHPKISLQINHHDKAWHASQQIKEI